ncbi:hypothetical protein [Verrucosispora sp. WMMD573]|uniref:hypothetical protein n=1 Tax=Verrucosispora sp. WMMD573 TaxID=3015149 RepID=UPI00248D224A|nr:hypothetical protein [Verrucosispora sp. WMMD573]WBB52579.1 hypothetical protein O7601_18540 [Verrucosispora sp. WMMD573]
MDGIAAQLPALLGVLVGAVGTIVATSLADRSRWRRNQTVRWDERRLDAYAEFARALKEAHTIASRLIGGYLDRDAELAALAEADFRHTLSWENVLLLGDGPTVTAARAWRDSVWAVERLARDGPNRDDAWDGSNRDDAWDGSNRDELPGLLHQANEARDAFYTAARNGLGVGGGSVAQAELLVSRLNLPTAPPAGASADR